MGYVGHLTLETKPVWRGTTVIAVIPGGLTSVVQPLDVCLNDILDAFVNNGRVDDQKVLRRIGIGTPELERTV
ncbi:hypothetical protein Hamer_G015084 [Homarus americanus]|uniref:Uncharacterized protein n=1 Tax=Homarus americanus TaxID=6706 RepID=A0A8J5MKD0_HOMAM|nr:hypothetical protein Hamer_G015084 [Homarus americanus]